MAVELEVLREELEKNGHTITAIADALQLDKGTVSKILKEIYTGREATKIKVLKHCENLVQKKPVSLSDDILTKSELYERLMLKGSLIEEFKPEEREHFIKIYKELRLYNKRKKSNRKKAA